MTKGIILAGGYGKRLYPLTSVTNKHLLPVYNKPMIYYPLTTLMLSGIKEFLIITTPDDRKKFEKLFGDGGRYGISLKYAEQTVPRGLADAFIIGEEFINHSRICMILGDNIFYGNRLPEIINCGLKAKNNAVIFSQYVKDPKNFGVVEYDHNDTPIKIIEKPDLPKSNHVVTGLYIYDPDVVDIAKSLEPSSRGELEITDINNIYLEKNRLQIVNLGRGMTWLDAGTAESLHVASQYIQVIESLQNIRIACIEEVAYRMKFIDKTMFRKLILPYKSSSYGMYLENILDEVKI